MYNVYQMENHFYNSINTCFAGPFHDGSPYFQKFEIRVGRNFFERNSEQQYIFYFLQSSIAGEKKFDIELARSLEGKFKVIQLMKYISTAQIIWARSHQCAMLNDKL